MPKQQKEDLKNALQELEKIVEELNNEEIDVETALEKFKRGVYLIKICRQQLQKAENEFKKLKADLEVEGELEAPEEIE